MQNTAAKRYSAALHQLAREQGTTKELVDQLEALAKIIQDQPALKKFLSNPKVEVQDKRILLAEIGEKLQLEQALKNLLNLLLDKGRIGIISGLAQEFKNLDDAHENRVRVLCKSAKPLTQEQSNSLRERLLKVTRAKDVLITMETDPSLLAGVVISLDGKIIDGSLKGRLDTLQQHLVENVESARLR